MSDFTVEAIKDIVPRSHKSMITEALVTRLNEVTEDPELADSFIENFVTYSKVLQSSSGYRIGDYINAVKFVSYKLLGRTDIDAWIMTFPDRHKRLSDRGLAKADMNPHAHAYTKTKLVVSIFEQTIIPTYVLNAPLHQEALTELSKIMTNGRSEMARVNAAGQILAYTKPPEEAKIKIDIGMDTSDAVAELRKATEELSLAQLQSIKAGQAVKEIAESTIVDAEIVED